MIHHMDGPADTDAREMPDFTEPMLARLAALPANDVDWAFEVKWDGVRAIARSEPGRFTLLSRNGKEITAAYPELRGLNRALGSHAAMLDGEIVAFDAEGRPSFEALQPRMHLRGETAVSRIAQSTPVTYVLFDLLWLDGHSLLSLPYSERRARLQTLKLEGAHWRTPEHRVGQGEAFLAATREQGLEGLIAKRVQSRYAPGGRGGEWLKIKNVERQELVIGGWSEGKGSRAARIGALHLGIFEGPGELRYAGRVGTGFDEQELERLAKLLSGCERRDSPFTGRQPPRGARFVEPELVCEVEFTEWTRAGLLRHPSYKGLRADKAAATVVRERAAAPPDSEPMDPSEGLGIARLIEEGREVRGGVEVELEGRVLKLTNLDKVLYPQTGFTKGDLIEYYASIAPVLLPHVRGRPLTLKRYPDGIEGKFFYEKQCPKHRPDWVQTATVWSEHSKREIHFCLCENLPTLVWMANLADIELHPSLARAEAIERPRTLAFDLDPGAPASIVDCCEVGLELRAMFAELSILAFAKTSGSKGLQVYVPLNDEQVTYAQTKPFARAVAGLFEERRPELVVSSMAKAQRPGKVLIDWSQNDEHKTTVSVYSLRAKATPTVSTPVSWEEVEACRNGNDPTLLEFGAEQVLARVRAHGDLFAAVVSLEQQLPAIGA